MSRPKGTCPDCKLPVAECLCLDEDDDGERTYLSGNLEELWQRST